MSAPLKADREQIELFVCEMFKHATPNTWASLRSFYNDKEIKGPALPFETLRIVPKDLSRLIDKAATYATRCANQKLGVVFCPPIATFKSFENATTENLADVLVLSVECDGRAREAVKNLATIIGEPTIVIASGGTWVDPQTGEVEALLHAHWRLRQSAVSAEDHANAQRARRIMREIAGSDGTAVPAVHPLRWPGTWHRKNIAQPRMACIVDCDEFAEVDLADALAALDKIAIARDIGAGEARTPNPEKMAPLDAVGMWMRAIPNPHPLLAPDDVQKRWEWWNYIGMALHAATGGAPEGLKLFQKWSAKHPLYNTSDELAKVAARWRHWHRSPATQLGAGTLCFWFTEFFSDASLDEGWGDDYAA